MLRHIKSAVIAVHDWARPWCATCNRHALRHNHCSLCLATTANNRRHDLLKNLDLYDISDQQVLDAKWVCDQCFMKQERAKCGKTGLVFFGKDNRIDAYLKSEMRNNLSPYHPDSNLRGPLSPEGYLLIEVEHEEVQEQIANWAGGTREETLRGFRIIKQIGVVRSDTECGDPAEVEHYLMWHAAQVGGNAFIKFFWDKRIAHHDERYIAGYGKKGNPYYRTRHYTTQHFTGHAVAVLAEPLEPRQRMKAPHSSKP
ncbi:MAG: hypothetical protein WCO51_13385 [bacterium]